MGEAATKGAANVASFGTSGAIAGLGAAAGETGQRALETEQQAIEANPMAGEAAGGAMLAQPLIGAFRMVKNAFADHPDPKVKEAYERGRQAWVEDERLAREQHPMAYLGGMLAAGMLMPSFGAFAPATAGVRAIRGATAGGAGGLLYGVGENISQGKPAAEIPKLALESGLIGAGLGGTFGAAFGPRVRGMVTPGERAAATAEALGAPLPRGVTSDRPITQATTSNIMSLPVIGPRIRSGVHETERAAGEAIEGTAGRLAGPGSQARADAARMVRPGVQRAIDNNMAQINAAYNALRASINPDLVMPMPRLTATLNRLEYDRIAAGWANPGQGFEQFRRLAQRGASFNGAHRARMDARAAGNVVAPHPGYNAADYNQITRAITADLRQNVTDQGGRQALQQFEVAERQFGPLAEMNEVLTGIRDAGETGIATILNAAREKGGNLDLLQQLQRTMPRQQFEVLSGLLMNELGQSAKTGEFSLAQFATNFNKLSDGAVRTMFTPAHAQALRSIAEMGEHIKRALETASTSHSSNWLAMLDILKDVALLGHEFGSTGGLGGMETMVGAATTGTLYTMGWILGSPARAASTAAWMRAYTGLTGSPTPARIAAFNIATRNLANTLGIPVERLMQSIASRAPRAQDQQQSVPGEP
jgi:hypothetical protein